MPIKRGKKEDNGKGSLEQMVSENGYNNMTKVMVVGDIHAPFQDKKNLDITRQFMKDYKPNVFVFNGDVIDFYSISKYDKSPARKENLESEIESANYCIDYLLKGISKDAKKYFLEGNHEYRLQSFIWKNPAFYGLEVVDIKNLLGLDRRGIKMIRGAGDYWKKQSRLKIGDTMIMHGDNRLDGASSSKNSGYSVSNTMKTMLSNVVMGHIHRGAVVYQTTPNGILTGVEGGKLCQDTGTANWQSGFTTFEVERTKGHNFRFHHIDKGKLYENGKIYKSK